MNPLSIWMALVALAAIAPVVEGTLVVSNTTTTTTHFDNKVEQDGGGTTKLAESVVVTQPAHVLRGFHNNTVTTERKLEPTYTINVNTKSRKQQVRFGIDAERLWWWNTRQADRLAELAVKKIKIQQVRVAINCAYEREQGEKKMEAYDYRILPMMKSLKAANPDIKFFASPRPLKEAYSSEETKKLPGGSVPWSPYPFWIFNWQYKSNKWRPGTLHLDLLTQYFADYLSLMHDQGLDIDYLDMVNENRFVTADQMAQVAKDLPSRLPRGVKMPLLVAPSSWSLEQGASWISGAPSTFFDIASVHNTGGGKTLKDMQDFVRAADDRGVQAWNTEMHGWVGSNLRDEIVNIHVLFDHFRAGFDNIETWLFFGNYARRSVHSMVNAKWKAVRTNGKYSIFRQLANEAAGKKYLVATDGVGGLKTAAFRSNKTLTIWVMNPSKDDKKIVIKLIGDKIISGRDYLHWHSGLSYGDEVNPDKYTIPTKNTDRMAALIKGESLYRFKLKIA